MDSDDLRDALPYLYGPMRPVPVQRDDEGHPLPQVLPVPVPAQLLHEFLLWLRRDPVYEVNLSALGQPVDWSELEATPSALETAAVRWGSARLIERGVTLEVAGESV
jgi:hypothetical protein